MQRMPHSSAAISAASSTCRSTTSSSNKSCNSLPFMMACLRASFHEMSKWSPLLGGWSPLGAIWPKYREIKAHALLPFLLSRVDWLKLSGNDHSVATVDSCERWPVKIACGIEGDNTVTLADLQCNSHSWCHISLIRLCHMKSSPGSVFFFSVVLVVLWFFWFLWFSWFSGACGSLVLLVLLVRVVLWFFCFSSSCGSHGFPVIVASYPVALAARSPAIGTACDFFHSISSRRGNKKFVPFRIRSRLGSWKKAFHCFVPQSVMEWFNIFARGHGTTRELFSQCTRTDECFDWRNNTWSLSVLRGKRKVVLHCRGATSAQMLTMRGNWGIIKEKSCVWIHL